jgi:signal transduction histidine kinase/DNA-binding NarL/FixJ family response regulator
MACVRILIADDHELVRQGLRALLASRPAWEVCGEAADGVEAIEKAAQLQPDIVLLDVSMPRLNGLEAAAVIRRESPASEIVIVSQHDPAEMLPSALQAGARGFVSKSDIASNLLSTIESIVGPARRQAAANDAEPRLVTAPLSRRGERRSLIRPRERGAALPDPLDPERQRAERLLLEQNHLLELIARGRPLDDCLRAITESVAHLQPGVRAAMALLDGSRARIERIVSSRLPTALAAELRALPIVGHSAQVPCGAALRRGEPVTCADIARDARWSVPWRELCIAHGVGAVHTTPVWNADGIAIASFFICLGEAREPNAWERDLVQFGAHLGSLAIERKQVEETLRQRSAQFEILVNQAPIGVFLLDGDLRIRQVNPVARPAFGPIPDLVGRDYCELLRQLREPEYAAKVVGIFRHTLATGASHQAIEAAPPRDHSSSTEYYDWRVDRIPLPEGGHGVVCYFRNASVEVQARAALQEAHDHLESRVRERTDELEKAYRSLRVLSMRMMQMQDEDRRRIARDLHDSAGQLLAALGMELASLNGRAAALSPELAEDVNSSLQLVQQLTQEVRTASYLLHPPLLDDAGLSGALRWYVAGLSKRSGIAITLELDDALGRLPRDLEAAVFHIVQESLTNIHRHSGSKTATLRIARSGGRLLLDIEDEGSGIPAEILREIQTQGSGVGIAGMRERVLHFNGDIHITSVNTGTRIAVTFPVEPGSARSDALSLNS